MKKKNNTKKFGCYQEIWDLCKPLFKNGRPGDLNHAMETAQFILNYCGRLELDKDILVPVAFMHDIGHVAILPEHFKHVTGPQKIINSKLVHMLAGAKIAKDILIKVKYNHKKIQEIVDIISVHDADQLQNVDIKSFYNSQNKKIFHDIDSLDRYTENRIKGLVSIYPNRQELLKILAGYSDSFFYTEFKNLAKKRFEKLL
jgi:hypothetical protein